MIPTKLFSKVNCEKNGEEVRSKYEGFGPIETLANTRADLLIQKRKELVEKIKLDNKIINTGYGEFFKK